MADPIKGDVVVDVDEKYMSARICAVAPQHGGPPPTMERAREVLALNGIRYNIDQEVLEAILKEENFDKTFIIAKGTPPVDGRNGYLVYHFERKDGAQIKTDEFGNVDYRDLGTVQNIEENVVVADIFPETPGTPGKDIRGIEIPQYPGKPAKIQTGSGISLSPDGKHLVTNMAGNLRWMKDHFIVEKELSIRGDIDLSVGNIDFIGDINIKGSISEGFVVKSRGNISISGNATGAVIEAEGDIVGKLGFVGCQVKSGGNIKVSFCENSDITCAGNLSAQSLEGCSVYCEGTITVQGGKAAIVGGKYTCMSNVEASYIGSDAYVRTMIVLGNIAVLAEEKLELKKKLKEYESQLSQLEMVCNALKAQKKAGPLSPEREEMLKNSIKAKFGHMGLIKETNDRIAEIDEEMSSTNDLTVTVNKSVFPGVTVRINNSQLVITDKKNKCLIKMGKDRDVIIQ